MALTELATRKIMENLENAAPEFDLNKILSEAKEEVQSPESQTENEPVELETEKKEDSNVTEETDETQEYKKNAKTRIQELLKDRKEQDERIKRLEEEQNKVKKEFEERKPTAPSDNQSQIPSWFVKLYGYNEEAWKIYDAGIDQKIQTSEERIIEKAMERITSQQTAENERRNAIQRQIDEAADKFDVNSSELRKFATDHPILMPDGNFDFAEIVEYMKYKKGNPAKTKARKEVTSIRNSHADSNTKKDIFTAKDFRF